MNAVLNHNQRAWDERVQLSLSHTEQPPEKWFEDPGAAADVNGWLGRHLTGQRVLCLAAGGGRHGPVFAAAGASVTVVDLSPKMLELDRAIAAQRRLSLRAIEASMDDLSMLGCGAFDVVIQPVSTAYIPDILKMYGEVARVLREGGLYLSQHKQPASLQTSAQPGPQGYRLEEPYYRAGPLPSVPIDCGHRESGCLEFLHRWEELLGGLCRSGFVIEDVIEPRHGNSQSAPGSFEHRSQFVPPFVAIKARRVSSQKVGVSSSTALWLPPGS